MKSIKTFENKEINENCDNVIDNDKCDEFIWNETFSKILGLCLKYVQFIVQVHVDKWAFLND